MLTRRLMLLGLAASGPLSSRRLGATGATWPSGVVSVTYDDGLNSQLDVAAPALTKLGLRATFYVTWDNIQGRADEWKELGRAGHEVTDHTVHHPCDLEHLSSLGYRRRELKPMERWLDSQFGTHRLHDFAYPCDVTNLGAGAPNQQFTRFRHALGREGIQSARTSEGPPMSPGWAARHPFNLQALAFGYDATSVPEVTRYIARAQATGRWAIIIFHDVVSKRGKSGDATADEHAAVLQFIADSQIECAPVGQVIATLAT